MEPCSVLYDLLLMKQETKALNHNKSNNSYRLLEQLVTNFESTKFSEQLFPSLEELVMLFGLERMCHFPGFA